MSKRLGKRERAKLRHLQASHKAIVRDNLSRPAPERSTLHSPSNRNALLGNSHTLGFNDPRGNLAKAKVVHARAIPAHRYSLVDANGASYGGLDRKADIRVTKERLEAWLSKPITVVDNRPWLD